MAELFINDKKIPNIEVTNVIEGITKRKNTVKELADIDPEAYVIELRLNICPNDTDMSVSDILMSLSKYVHENSVSSIRVGQGYKSTLYKNIYSVEYYGDGSILIESDTNSSIIVLCYAECDKEI